MTSPQTHSRPSTLSALALAIAALSHVGAHAAASQDELKGTKLYASVSIADDSTDSWGPWSNFEPPAAGRDVSPALPKVSTELYRPLAQVPSPVTPSFGPACVAGGLCGFGAFQGNDSSRNNNSSMSVAPHAVQLAGVVTQTDETALPKAIQMYTTALTPGVSILMPDSGELLRIENTDGNSYMSDSSVQYSRSSQSESNGVQRNERVDLYGSSNLPEETQLLDGSMYTNISNYTKGVEGQREQFSSSQGRGGPVVWGYTTSDADIAALRADKAKASYDGYAYGGAPVHMDVDLGLGTWTASWNDGKDGKVAAYGGKADGTGKVLYGSVGFTAEGTIKGVMLQSTSVGTKDIGATVSGQVNAAFYGMQAAAIGGVADITKTMPASPNLQPASVGSPQSPGYTNARYVETFTAVKVVDVKRD
ncbi:MAG: hypothetical protein Q7U28_12235 [Aquabacterium sp.]|nr:hypothetical protein [Aquabacterium sp.]